MQARVSGSCAVGEAISAIAADDTVICQAAQAPPCADRFCACSDGLTVEDTGTSLLWERKKGTPVAFSGVVCETAAGGCPDPHDVSNTYEWSNTGTAADGNA